MKALVVFDSNFGNTQKIAETVAKQLQTQAISIYDVSTYNLRDIDLMVVGSPINGWKATQRIDDFLSSIGPGELKGVKAAAFDTRVNLFFHGDAAGKIAHALQKLGAQLIVPAQEFFVEGKEGPLLKGELEKAIKWANLILSKSHTRPGHFESPVMTKIG